MMTMVNIVIIAILLIIIIITIYLTQTANLIENSKSYKKVSNGIVPIISDTITATTEMKCEICSINIIYFY